MILFCIVLIVATAGGFYLISNQESQRKEKLRISLLNLKQYNFPIKVLNEFKQQYPKLNEHEIKFVETGLKDFFALVLLNPRQSIAMPSRVIDDLWHIFLEDKEEYAKFCKLINKEIKHVADEKAEKGFDRQKPVRRVSSDVRKTFNAFKQSNNNGAYDFTYLGVLPLLFIMDNHLPSIEYGYFYDKASFDLMNAKAAAVASSSSSCSSGPSSSCSSASSCSSGSCGDSSCGSGGCSCSSSCGSSCGGGCGGGCGS